MATIDTLVASGGLIDIKVPLERGELPHRLVYGYPDFRDWLENEVPKMTCGRLNADEPPCIQVDNRLHQWISGKRIVYSTHFKDLSPLKDEVWELKTADTRVFGWMHRPCVFIAVFGDAADLYKYPTRRKSYEDARAKVISARDRINLDHPKLTGGTFDDLVCV
jgi:hypothetical protein